MGYFKYLVWRIVVCRHLQQGGDPTWGLLRIVWKFHEILLHSKQLSQTVSRHKGGGWAVVGGCWAGLVQRCRPRQPPPGPGSCCQHTWTQTCSAQLYAGAGHCPAQPRNKICVFLMLIHISVNQKLFQNSQMSIQHPVISLISLWYLVSFFYIYIFYITDIFMDIMSTKQIGNLLPIWCSHPGVVVVVVTPDMTLWPCSALTVTAPSTNISHYTLSISSPQHVR